MNLGVFRRDRMLRKRLQNGHILEKADAENLQDCAHVCPSVMHGKAVWGRKTGVSMSEHQIGFQIDTGHFII
jgi:hypothetical protein